MKCKRIATGSFPLPDGDFYFLCHCNDYIQFFFHPVGSYISLFT